MDSGMRAIHITKVQRVTLGMYDDSVSFQSISLASYH